MSWPLPFPGWGWYSHGGCGDGGILILPLCRLLRAAAGFPTSSGARQQLNEVRADTLQCTLSCVFWNHCSCLEDESSICHESALKIDGVNLARG